MDAVSAGGESDIDARIHQYFGGGGTRQIHDPAYQMVQLARAQILLPHLNPLHAIGDGAFHITEQRVHASGGAAIGDVIAEHSGRPVVAFAGAGAAEGLTVAGDFAVEIDAFSAEIAGDTGALEAGHVFGADGHRYPLDIEQVEGR